MKAEPRGFDPDSEYVGNILHSIFQIEYFPYIQLYDQEFKLAWFTCPLCSTKYKSKHFDPYCPNCNAHYIRHVKCKTVQTYSMRDQIHSFVMERFGEKTRN